MRLWIGALVEFQRLPEKFLDPHLVGRFQFRGCLQSESFIVIAHGIPGIQLDQSLRRLHELIPASCFLVTLPQDYISQVQGWVQIEAAFESGFSQGTLLITEISYT